MRHTTRVLLASLPLLAACSGQNADDSVDSLGDDLTSHTTVHVWMTSKAELGTRDLSTRDKAKMIARRADLGFAQVDPSEDLIRVADDAGHRFQTIEGFGASLTYASGSILAGDAEGGRVLEELMSPTRGIGLSMLRQSIGANDEITGSEPFSYDDGSADPRLDRFSVDAHDAATMLPLLRRALQINPDIRVIASPWSAPGWMKWDHTLFNNHGGLDGQYYGAYADYLTKFVVAYEARGIPIWAITPQNEPNNPAPGYPGMNLDAPSEASLIARHLAPALRRAGKGHVKILAGDGAKEEDRYGLELFRRAETEGGKDALAGFAFHCYGGQAPLIEKLYKTLPAGAPHDMYVTECTSSDEVKLTPQDRATPEVKRENGQRIPSEGAKGEAIEELIASARSYAKGFIAFNLVHHQDGNPHIGNGCNGCVGVVSLEHGAVTYERDYAYLGHASRFVQRGARRVDSNTLPGGGWPRIGRMTAGGGGIENVAFLNPNGTRVLVVYNSSDDPKTFQVEWPAGSNQAFKATVPGRSPATFTW